MSRWQTWNYLCDSPLADCELVKLNRFGRYEERMGKVPPAGWTNERQKWFCPLCSKQRAKPGAGHE